MKAKLYKVVLLFLIALGLSVGFFAYGSVRTTMETFGFNVITSLYAMALTICSAIAVLYPILYLITRVYYKEHSGRLRFLLIGFGIALLAGCFNSEALILYDETDFFYSSRKATGIYSRSRAWPNEGGSLVSIPNKGIHATD